MMAQIQVLSCCLCLCIQVFSTLVQFLVHFNSVDSILFYKQQQFCIYIIQLLQIKRNFKRYIKVSDSSLAISSDDCLHLKPQTIFLCSWLIQSVPNTPLEMSVRFLQGKEGLKVTILIFWHTTPISPSQETPLCISMLVKYVCWVVQCLNVTYLAYPEKYLIFSSKSHL